MEYSISRKVAAFVIAPLAAVVVSALFCLYPAAPNGREWLGAVLLCSALALPVAYVATFLAGGAALAWSRSRSVAISRRLAIWCGFAVGLVAGLASALVAVKMSLAPAESWSVASLLAIAAPFLSISLPTGGVSGFVFQMLLGPPEAAG